MDFEEGKRRARNPKRSRVEGGGDTGPDVEQGQWGRHKSTFSCQRKAISLRTTLAEQKKMGSCGETLQKAAQGQNHLLEKWRQETGLR